MSKLEIQYPPGATPLDPDELGGLIPNYITTQGELNQLERENILEAAQWALGRSSHDCLNISFWFDLLFRFTHFQMATAATRDL